MPKYNFGAVKTVADHYGKDKQLIKLIEELAELAQTVCKYRDAPDDFMTRKAMVNEMADVENMLAQIKYLCDIDNTEVDIAAADKIKRQIFRIRKEKDEIIAGRT